MEFEQFLNSKYTPMKGMAILSAFYQNEWAEGLMVEINAWLTAYLLEAPDSTVLSVLTALNRAADEWDVPGISEEYAFEIYKGWIMGHTTDEITLE
jgi:hypothetical protein